MKNYVVEYSVRSIDSDEEQVEYIEANSELEAIEKVVEELSKFPDVENSDKLTVHKAGELSRISGYSIDGEFFEFCCFTATEYKGLTLDGLRSKDSNFRDFVSVGTLFPCHLHEYDYALGYIKCLLSLKKITPNEYAYIYSEIWSLRDTDERLRLEREAITIDNFEALESLKRGKENNDLS